MKIAGIAAGITVHSRIGGKREDSQNKMTKKYVSIIILQAVVILLLLIFVIVQAEDTDVARKEAAFERERQFIPAPEKIRRYRGQSGDPITSV